MTTVKICGITNHSDAQLAVRFGADALGFNFYAKSPRYVEPARAREITDRLSQHVERIGVFVNEDVSRIVDTVHAASLSGVQLHGDEDPEVADELKQATKAIVIKAFRITDDFEPERVNAYTVDAVLLDGSSRNDFGGTGTTFDWEIAKQVSKLNKPIYLAGGLSNENIVAALQDVRPFAVDACSCLEATKGTKDNVKLINFITRIKEFDRWFARNESQSGLVENIRDYMALIHLRPAMYIGSQSVTALGTHLGGFLEGMRVAGKDFDASPISETEFHNYIKDRLGKRDLAALNGFSIQLYDESDEKRAFEHFFALFHEYLLKTQYR